MRDRPWGQTLGSLGLRGLTGQVTLRAEDKDYAIAFDLGGVIGAWSPNAADSAPRVALTNHLLSSSQVAAIARRIAAQPDRDEVDIVAEMARLSPEQVDTLRGKLVAQRAARSFSVEDGEFMIEDEITIPVIPGPGLDIRSVVYLGARMNLSEQRLTTGLRHFGAYFQLRRDAAAILDRFSFTDAERPVLVELNAGTSLHELEAAHREIDPRMVQAVVYALFACGACEVSDAPAMPRAATVPSVPRTARGSGSQPAASEDAFPMRTPTPPVTPGYGRPNTEEAFPMRTPTPPVSGLYSTVEDLQRRPISGPDRATTENPFPVRQPTPPMTSRTSTDNPFPVRSPTPPVEARTKSGGRAVNGPDEAGVPRQRSASASPTRINTPSAGVRIATPRPGGAPASTPVVARTGTDNPAVARTGTGGTRPAVARTGTGPAIARTTTARKTAALVAARMILLEQGADHFALLGVPFDAPIETVRTTYLNLARQLHPDKIAELDVADSSGKAQQLFTSMGIAFSVLTDPVRRAAYLSSMTAAAPMMPRTKTGDDAAGTPATEALRRGESALRRDEPYEAVAHFQRAVELAPNDADYQAMLAWAQFCAATDKETTAVETRKTLERTIYRSAKPVAIRLLLGRVERMLGRDREALRQFQIVLEDEPSHTEARSEIRAIEARLKR
ncbi:hypothetical protein BH11MYX3_BH11MYX3_38380 [soil metagenome]